MTKFLVFNGFVAILLLFYAFFFFSVYEAGGIVTPNQGWNPHLLQGKELLTTGHRGSPEKHF